MTPKILQLLLFTFIKFVTGTLVYFFVEFYKHDEDNFFYTFLGFYMFERLVCFFSIVANLTPPKWEIVLIGCLNPIQLEEIYLLLRGNRYPRYQSEGIDGQAFVISVFSIPLYIITLVWTVYNPTTINIVFTSFGLTAFMFGLFFISFIAYYDKDHIVNYNDKNFIFQMGKELSFAGLHFLTFIGLLCVNFQLNNFIYYLLTTYIVIVTSFIISIRKRVVATSFSTFEVCYIIFFMICKEILHIVVDCRNTSTDLKRNSIQTYGFQTFNKQLLFCFMIKLYLLVMFSVFLYSNNSLNEMNDFYIILYTASLLSVLILGLRVFMYQILPLFIGQNVIEFDDVNQLIKACMEKRENNYYKNLEVILVFQRNLNNISKDLIYTFLYGFSKSEIALNGILRSNLNNDRNQQSVKFTSVIDYTDLIEIIQSYGSFLPQIQSVYITLNQTDQLYNLYRLLSNSNMPVCLQTNLAGQQFFELNQITSNQVRITALQYTAFKYLISNEMSANPQMVFYDLLDDFYQ